MANSNYFEDMKNMGKKRSGAHMKGEKGVSILKALFPDEWVVREYIPDYGIDLDVELFDNKGQGLITKGEHVLFQVKGTEKLNKGTKKIYSRMNVEKGYKEDKSDCYTMEVVKYSIDRDLLTAIERMGSAVPVLLCVVDIINRDAYCVCLNDYIEKVLIPQKADYYNQKTVVIDIPIKNYVNTDAGKHIIEWYGKRAKLYAFFNKVHYQLKELQYCSSLEYKNLSDHFLKILCRLDIWSAVDYFPALKDIKKDIDYYLEHHSTEMSDKMLKTMIEREEDVDSTKYEGTYCAEEISLREFCLTSSLNRLWERLCLVADIFEENAKEAFLPSYLSNFISY